MSLHKLLAGFNGEHVGFGKHGMKGKSPYQKEPALNIKRGQWLSKGTCTQLRVRAGLGHSQNQNRPVQRFVIGYFLLMLRDSVRSAQTATITRIAHVTAPPMFIKTPNQNQN